MNGTMAWDNLSYVKKININGHKYFLNNSVKGITIINEQGDASNKNSRSIHSGATYAIADHGTVKGATIDKQGKITIAASNAVNSGTLKVVVTYADKSTDVVSVQVKSSSVAPLPTTTSKTTTSKTTTSKTTTSKTTTSKPRPTNLRVPKGQEVVTVVHALVRSILFVIFSALFAGR